MSVKDVFLDLVSYPTASDETTGTTPSTPGQKVLGAHIVEHMKSIGIADARMDEMGYVYGTIPATAERGTTVGFIAHMDTYGGVSGENIHPQVIENYDGGAIALGGSGLSLSPAAEPALLGHVGKTLITTDGTTLLGGDDKAGVAEILAAAQILLESKQPHATLRIGFTPDEEIGRGADRFSVPDFGADYAYTVDGGTVGELEFENFNAAAATVKFQGLNIHPGSAKDKMVNSQYIAMEFESLLPRNQKPEYTEGYEGFIHLTDMEGCVEHSTLRYIIRDHSMEKFQEKKRRMESAAAFLNDKYGEGTVELTIKDSYYNMKEPMMGCMQIVYRAKAAMEAVGLTPRVVPVRGGTDGARLSYMGLLCPNLFTGGENYHGRFEYIPVEDMELAVKVLVQLLTDFPAK